VGDVEDLGRLVHFPVDHVAGGAAQLQAEGHVLVDRHVRVERVVLEDHGNIPVLGGDVVDDGVADDEVACGDFLQPRDHAQRRGFSAARRTDQNDEFLVGDLQVDIVHHGQGPEGFSQLSE